MTLEDRPAPDEGSTREEVVAVVRAIASRGWSLAGTGAQAVGSGADETLRFLVDRRIERALRPDAAAVGTDELIEALDTGTGSATSLWIGAGAARLARTGRAARIVGGRTPIGLAVRFGPALYAAVSSNIRSLDAAAGRLVTRARQRRIDPDPERLRRVVVQALAGSPIDPEAEVDHNALLRVWLGDAGRRAVPFGLDRISGLRGGRTPEAIAAVIDSVDVARLTPR